MVVVGEIRERDLCPLSADLKFPDQEDVALQLDGGEVVTIGEPALSGPRDPDRITVVFEEGLELLREPSDVHQGVSVFRALW